MCNALLIALAGGIFAAIVNVSCNLYIKISDRNIENKIKKINALSSVEYLICNLGVVKPFDMYNKDYYYSIFENINSIESYVNSIRLINQYRFYLSHVIIVKIELLESVFQDIISSYYLNRGNEDMTILEIGAENFNVISAMRKELRDIIDEELRKLKK